MKLYRATREANGRIVLSGSGTSQRYLNGRVFRLARVEQPTKWLYVLGSDAFSPQWIAVAADDTASHETLDSLPQQSDPVAVDRLLAELERDAPESVAEDAVVGHLRYCDPVLTVIAGPRRWDVVPGREPGPAIRSMTCHEDGTLTLLVRMPDDERIRLKVAVDDADATYRAVAVLRADGAASRTKDKMRWQYGVVNIGMFKAMDRMNSVFARLGSEGWELISIYDKSSNWLAGMEKGFMLFKRPVQPGIELLPSEWCRTLSVTGLS